ncbi:MAG: copper ion binding protein, partial [Spiribacter salinus]
MAEKTLNLEVTGLTCGSCVRRVETVLQALPGVADATVNLATARAELTLNADAEASDVASQAATALAEAGYPAATTEITLEVTGMTCGGCVSHVEKALNAVPGVVSAQVNLGLSNARVTSLTGATSRQALV